MTNFFSFLLRWMKEKDGVSTARWTHSRPHQTTGRRRNQHYNAPTPTNIAHHQHQPEKRITKPTTQRPTHTDRPTDRRPTKNNKATSVEAYTESMKAHKRTSGQSPHHDHQLVLEKILVGIVARQHGIKRHKPKPAVLAVGISLVRKLVRFGFEMHHSRHFCDDLLEDVFLETTGRGGMGRDGTG